MKLKDIITKSIVESSQMSSDSSINEKFISNLELAANHLINTFENNGKVLLAGNGGSAADAQHIAAEFMGRLNFDRDPLPAISLTSNTSNLTCIANDYGYDHIFSRQAEALVDPNDSIIAYSTSGKSANIVKLVKEMRGKANSIIALTGSYTDHLSEYCDVILSVNSRRTTRIQEIHAIAGHILCECVEEHIFGKK